jgi:predicted Holliday junction resolvase-like endonuclease
MHVEDNDFRMDLLLRGVIQSMLEYLLIGLVIGLVFATVLYYILNLKLQHQMNLYNEQRKLLDGQEEMMKERYENEWVSREKKLGTEIANQQRASVKGKITEQIISLFKGDVFPYEPADARFLGAPIDYIIFDGYTRVKDEKSSDNIAVVLADVKTGSGKLTPEQNRMKKAIEEKRVEWRTSELPEI